MAERMPSHVVRWLFGTSVGIVAALLTGCGGTPESPAEADAGIRFVEVTNEAGLGDAHHENGAAGKKYYPEMMGSGAAFFDHDGDGWLDILYLGGGKWDGDAGSEPQSIWLFRNNQNGTFSEITEQVGLGEVTAYTIGQSIADYDNDGDPDLVVTTLTRNLFFRNDGGRYVEVGREIGLGEESVWSSSALFFDADHDGWLDLYIANYADWTPENDKWCPAGSDMKLYCIPADYEGIASKYFRNNGDGTFSDRSWEDGFLPAIGKSLGVVEIDYNKDGWTDIAVSNDGEGDLLYENRRDGTFIERGVASGFAFSEHGEARSGMGIDAGVVDSTGQVTIFIGHFSNESSGVFHHLGNGLFRDRSTVSRVGHASMTRLTFGIFLLDADYDGDLDLFAANGHVQPDQVSDTGHITFRQPPQLFINSGEGEFTVFEGSDEVWRRPLVARAAMYGDFDRDGRLDILITENDGPIHLWKNTSTSGRFLRVRLSGRVSNRDALGSRLEAWVKGQYMERRVRSGSSYLSQMERTATFGVGNADKVDSLLIFWPSGRVDRFTEILADREIALVEGEDTFREVPLEGSTAR